MFENPSLVTRIAIGKAIGFALGLVGLFVIPLLWPDSGWMERIAFLFWYTTVGAFVGVIGVFNWHPILHLPMRWWFRSTLLPPWRGRLPPTTSPTAKGRFARVVRLSGCRSGVSRGPRPAPGP